MAALEAGWHPDDLLTHHDADLRAAVVAVLGDGPDADDATQEARLRAAAAASRLGPKARNYLRTIGRNCAVDRLRAQEPVTLIDLTDDALHPATDPFAAAEDRERVAEQVAVVAAVLSPRLLAMLEDRADGLSEAELADRYDLAPASVSVILSRARARARVALDRARDGLAAWGGWRSAWRHQLTRVGGNASAFAPLADAVPALVTAAAAVAVLLAPPPSPLPTRPVVASAPLVDAPMLDAARPTPTATPGPGPRLATGPTTTTTTATPAAVTVSASASVTTSADGEAGTQAIASHRHGGTGGESPPPKCHDSLAGQRLATCAVLANAQETADALLGIPGGSP